MDDHSTQSFSRRSFIKGAAALTAAGALVGCSPKSKDLEEVDARQGDPETQIFRGVCRGNCFGGCALNIHVRDGQVVRTSAADLPNPAYNRICSKGITQPARVYSAERLQYPMKRIGERGEAKFERISWDDAINEIASKWKGYSDEFGSSSIASFMASGNFGALAGGASAGVKGRFDAALGLSQINHDVDAASWYASDRIFGGLSLLFTNNEATDYINSKTFINWAANPAVSSPHIMHFIMEAKENGTKVIVIDPVYNATASKADWYIPINPTTDGVLAMAIMNEIIASGIEDQDFVRSHTESPLLIKEDGTFLRMSDLGVAPTTGEPDHTTGEPTVVNPPVVWDESSNSAVALDKAKTPAYKNVAPINGFVVQTVWENLTESVAKWSADAAASVCGVPVETIKELARIYVEEGPVNSYMGQGADHYKNGHYSYWAMFALSAITGNIGKPGAAVGLYTSSPKDAKNYAAATAPTDKEGNPAPGAGPSYNMNKVLDILNTGKFGEKDATLKSIYVVCGNPATIWTDHEKTREVLQKIDFFVVSDMVMSETATYADILLPVCHWFEMEDMFDCCHNHPYAVWQEKAIEPQFESKSDFDIFKLIVEKMGQGKFFDLTGEEYLAETLDNEVAKSRGLTVERIKEEHAVRFLPEETYLSFEGGNFPAKNGRAVFYLEKVTPAYSVGQVIDESKEKSMYWEAAREATSGTARREQYPFQVISEHARTRTHSQWFDVECLKEYEPKPLARFNPEDATGLGIVEGDAVRMFNDRGSVVLTATISYGYPRGVVGSPRSYHQKEFIEGHFASLSSSEYNQVCANQTFNDVAVAIEKA